MYTDPPNVPTLNETLTTLETLINVGNFTVSINIDLLHVVNNIIF